MTAERYEQMAGAQELDARIRRNLKALGFGNHGT